MARSHLLRIASALLLFLPLFGCGRGVEGSSADERPGQRGDAASQPPIPVAVEEARIGPIASYYSATATLEVRKEAEVLARVSGIVKKIEAEEGEFVQQDSVLLRIENNEYRLRVDQAAATTKNLKSRFDRMKELSRDLVSVEEFETVKNDLETAEANEGLARLTLSYTTVTAPFTGRVVRRLVDVGQNVNVNTPLFMLADFNPLLARVHVPSKEFRKIETDQTVELVLDSNKQRLQGRIWLVSPTIDPTTGTIKVTVEIRDYPEDTRPGDFAEVRIVTERHPSGVLVSRSAVFTDKGDQVVYVAVGTVAERRVVEMGFTTEDRAEILSGIRPGDRVVVKGQRSLKHGYPLKILEDDLPASALTPGSVGS